MSVSLVFCLKYSAVSGFYRRVNDKILRRDNICIPEMINWLATLIFHIIRYCKKNAFHESGTTKGRKNYNSFSYVWFYIENPHDAKFSRLAHTKHIVWIIIAERKLVKNNWWDKIKWVDVPEDGELEGGISLFLVYSHSILSPPSQYSHIE